MRTYLPLPVASLCLLFAVSGYFAVRFPDMPGTSVGSLVSTALIALPAVWALFRRFGATKALPALAALSLLGFAVELTGVATGFPYGEFSYSTDLGPKVFGLVPYLLPVSWVPLVLGTVAATERRSGSVALRDVLGWTLSAAMLLTALDGVLDPGAARLGFWQWPQGGPYYGVPLSNYGGWLLSSLLASALLFAVLPWRTTPPVPAMLDSTLISLAFWTSVALFTGLGVPFLLGSMLFAGLLRRRAVLQRLATRVTLATTPDRAAPRFTARGLDRGG